MGVILIVYYPMQKNCQCKMKLGDAGVPWKHIVIRESFISKE